MFAKSCRLVNQHSVSPTYVADVSFLCHCVLHSMEGSKKSFIFDFDFKFNTLQSNKINHIQCYLDCFHEFKSFPQFHKVPLLCFFEASASNPSPQHLRTKSPSCPSIFSMFGLHHKRWFHLHSLCL